MSTPIKKYEKTFEKFSLTELVKKRIARRTLKALLRQWMLPCWDRYAQSLCSSLSILGTEYQRCVRIVKSCAKVMFLSMLRRKRLKAYTCTIVLKRINKVVERFEKKCKEGLTYYCIYKDKYIQLKSVLERINVLDVCKHMEGCYGIGGFLSVVELWERWIGKGLMVRISTNIKEEYPRICVIPKPRVKAITEEIHGLDSSFSLLCKFTYVPMAIEMEVVYHSPSDLIRDRNVSTVLYQSPFYSDPTFINMFPIYSSDLGLGCIQLDCAPHGSDNLFLSINGGEVSLTDGIAK